MDGNRHEHDEPRDDAEEKHDDHEERGGITHVLDSFLVAHNPYFSLNTAADDRIVIPFF
jgi:hypothetical protein